MCDKMNAKIKMEKQDDDKILITCPDKATRDKLHRNMKASIKIMARLL